MKTHEDAPSTAHDTIPSPPPAGVIRELRRERGALTNPIARIAFDNEWIGNLPVGLWLMVTDEEGEVTP